MALAQIGTSVVTSIVQSFVKMATEWLATHVIMAGISSLFRTKETTETGVHAGLQVGIHAAGETAKTGATWLGALARGAVRLGETLYHATLTAWKVAVHVGAEILMTAVTLGQAAIRIGVILAEALWHLIKAAFKGADAVADVPYVGPIL